MMNDLAITVDSVSKKYKLFTSSRARLLELVNPFKVYHREFWALSNISFKVPKGQTYGLVGRNGSGKSTLLQILAGVLHPTIGEVTTQGRISALLELGAGFNPDFTGRDNVILNGVIMGLSQQEVEERLPLIIEFSELDAFVDQPVRTYSSGMFIRLAFAAAIHVDPDILIVDEALAVGDARFQRKCFRKIEQFREDGKTIFLVTHEAQAIVQHCDTAILMEAGQMIDMGSPKDIVNHYSDILSSSGRPSIGRPSDDGIMKEISTSSEAEGRPTKARPKVSTNELAHIGYDQSALKIEETLLGQFLSEKHQDYRCAARKSYNDQEYQYGDKRAEIIDYLIVIGEKYDPVMISSHDQLDLYFKVLFHDSIECPVYGVTIKRLDGVEIYGSNSLYEDVKVNPMKSGDFVIMKTSIKMSLTHGDYFISLGVVEQTKEKEIVPMDRRYDLIHFKVQQRNQCLGLVDLQASFYENVMS